MEQELSAKHEEVHLKAMQLRKLKAKYQSKLDRVQQELMEVKVTQPKQASGAHGVDSQAFDRV